MKKILLVLLLLSCSLLSLRARGAVELNLSFELVQGLEHKTRGNAKLVYMGACFVLEGNGFKVINNGSECWSLNMQSKEAVVDKALEVDINSSPEDILSALGVNSRDADIEINRSSDGKPVAISARLNDGSSLGVKVKSSKEIADPDASFFSFDASGLDRKWVITDLR